ncbi:aldolase [Aestuariicella hydrocarbonica]|uniref:Aldolase n=1 Tax=Pseudomaricurvus hydrocarbonicus TaxID=1470433 RepID=A0A9E5MNJ1_9GAMM|nr:aldolase/citrate lyase family protein [Aestuariicella hydrocarbonica]NHO67478.1 aldolase [Aestuariicella hydrocarbonica]
MSNSMVKALQGDKPLIGSWCAIANSLTAEITARSGFDFIVIDMQHGLLDYQDTVSMMQAMDVSTTPPVVRVPWNDTAMIGKVLDAGAMTVIVPMINTVEDVKAAVAACRYAPEGVRSFGPMRAMLSEGADYPLRANKEISLFAMIETQEALDNVEAIAAVPGVAGLFLGPFDLSLSLGLAPGNNDGEQVFDEALQRVLKAAKANNLSTGILANEALAVQRVQQGFDFVVMSTDFMTLAGGLQMNLAKVRTELDGDAAASSQGGGYGA